MRQIVLLVFFLSVTPAAASDVESRLLECRSLSTIPSRVNCYDQIADSLSPAEQNTETGEIVEILEGVEPVATNTRELATPTPVPRTVQPGPPATVSPARASIDKAIEPEELFGKGKGAVSEIIKKELYIRSLDQIKSLVAKVQQNHAKEFVVLLENGQVWKQKGDGGAWRIKQGEVAVISKASFGSFVMRAEGRKKGVRAVRIK